MLGTAQWIFPLVTLFWLLYPQMGITQVNMRNVKYPRKSEPYGPTLVLSVFAPNRAWKLQKVI